MKKISFVLFAALATLVACTKSASTIAPAKAPIVTTLAYDTAELISKNTSATAKLYDIDGCNIKLSVLADRQETAPYTTDYVLTGLTPDPDSPDKQQLQAAICKVDGTFDDICDISINEIPAIDQFGEVAALDEKGGYYLVYFDEEGTPRICFAVVVAGIEVNPYKKDVTYPKETPFGEDTVVEEDFENLTVTVLYHQFRNGAWL